MSDRWGPLRSFAGEWEGDLGCDEAFSHRLGRLVQTPYRERAMLTPFGPVTNGRQQLFGLDYRTTMWRHDESVPFHTETGYWLWDSATHEVLRAFVVPRGITVLAGGRAAPDAHTLALAADRSTSPYSIAENQYLKANASSASYRVTMHALDADTWEYEESTTLEMSELAEAFEHSDRNTLHRIR